VRGSPCEGATAMAAATAAVDATASVASTSLRSMVSRVPSRNAVSREAIRYVALRPEVTTRDSYGGSPLH
jgi:hypothetical protein